MSTRQKVYLTAPQVRKRYGDVSDMGLWRWQNDGKTNFPAPDLYINGRRLWAEETLDAFESRQADKREAA